MSRVFVTIVTYNGADYLADLFRSLRGEMNEACGVIVVDNASSDGTADWIANNVPDVILIRNKTNTGFTGGQNQAMRAAIEQGAEYVVLLNQDMVIGSGCIATLVKVADQEQHAAAVQPLVVLHGTEPERVNSWGNAQHYLGFGYAGGYKRLVSDAPSASTSIPYASGATVLYRVSVLKHVGLFPEHFFMYQEDLDMSWRMRLAGYELLLAPQARVYHKYDWQGAAKKYAMVERNRLATIFANYHSATLILLLPGIIAAEFGLIFISFFTGWWRQKLQGYQLLMSASYRTAVCAARVRAQMVRRVSDRAITARLTAIIDFQETQSAFVRWVLNPCFWLYFRLVRVLVFW